MAFYSYRLLPLGPLHPGDRRAGVVARCHRHLPGHLFSYALTATVAAARGLAGDDFAGHLRLLDEIRARFRFGPAFVCAEGRRLDDAAVEARCLGATERVTLRPGARSAVAGALFEVEVLRLPDGHHLAGGVWADAPELDGEPLHHWLGRLRLGGERRLGYGRVRCPERLDETDRYPGVGPVVGEAVVMAPGEILPGAALDGVENAPLRPWLGRRHDRDRGSGRAFSQAVLVRLHGQVPAGGGRYRPSAEEPGLGCWEPLPGPA